MSLSILARVLLVSLWPLCLHSVSLQAAEFTLTEPASYAGTLPCADCPGIHWHLDLWPEGRYHLRREYLNRDGRDDDMGRWRVNPADDSLLLFGGREAPIRLATEGSGALRLLALDGSPIESDLPYDLNKLNNFAPAEISTRMGGEFRYFADAATFGECLTGKTYPVLMEGAYRDAEGRYLEKEQSAGERLPIFLQIEGSIVNRQVMESEGPPQSLLITRVVAEVPGLRCERAMSTASLPNTYWRLLTMGGEHVRTPEGAREVHLVMHDRDSAVAGFAGCNRFRGQYAVNGDQLTFTPLASTMMACPEAQMRVEQDFHGAMGRVAQWQVAGQTLELSDEEGESLLVFEAVYLP